MSSTESSSCFSFGRASRLWETKVCLAVNTTFHHEVAGSSKLPPRTFFTSVVVHGSELVQHGLKLFQAFISGTIPAVIVDVMAARVMPVGVMLGLKSRGGRNALRDGIHVFIREDLWWAAYSLCPYPFGSLSPFHRVNASLDRPGE